MAFFWLLLIALIALAIYDLTQRKHAILRNFPVIGHLRYWLEAIGPEFRQYIVTDNDEERPFNRDQRRWVYASSKKQNNYFGFGTDSPFERDPHHLVVKHHAFPLEDPAPHTPGGGALHLIPCAKVLGGWRGRKKAFRPESIINISAMSYGSLSTAAINALNRGASIGRCLHNTGEGGISTHHLMGGGLIWQLGTGYFGARAADGGFDLDRFVRQCERTPVQAVEIKLSQGAKPGRGGVLPAAKVTPEIAAIRGIPEGIDCISPAAHTAFRDVPSLVDFVERLADATGLPVGIKSAVGVTDFWEELAEHMASTGRGPDFVTIDGGEGGTGAAPLVFADHVSLPFAQAFPRVYAAFARRGLHHHVVFIGSGRLGFPEKVALAFALGCDMVNIAREAMLAIGCIQAQRCHTGHCPTGVATQNAWLVRGLDPTHKAARFANYLVTLRKETLWLSHACGQPHPALVGPEHLEYLDGTTPLTVAKYDPTWHRLAPRDADAIRAIMNGDPDPLGAPLR
ncbi:MAG: FMN-binding glutamate synthase family protein [bacterium]